MLENFRDEFARYRLTGEKALRQIPDEALNRDLFTDGNSAAMIVRHLDGNLTSRFTDFLTSDGEKSWRDRDAEFETQEYSREEVERRWAAGWGVLESQLAQLSDADLAREVRIRGQPLTVHAALTRSLSHAAYHVGQIVLLARLLAGRDWEWISIPKGQSGAYNAAPTKEKRP
jgi:uncharacterized damage-inducible protein DinB